MDNPDCETGNHYKVVNEIYWLSIINTFTQIWLPAVNHLQIDSIRIPRQSWDEYALIMNARLMRGTSRQEDNKYEKTATEFAKFKETF